MAYNQAAQRAAQHVRGLGVLPDRRADHPAVSAAARLAAAVLLVRELRVIARSPVVMVARAWTLAIWQWGGTIVRPIVEGLGRLRRDRDDDDPSRK